MGMFNFRTYGRLVPTLSQIIQIAKGLKYLHEENVVHGDVRCVSGHSYGVLTTRA